MFEIFLGYLAIVGILVLLGNEIRLLIDERHSDRAERESRHTAGFAGSITTHALTLRDRAAEDRALFARVAQDFALTSMDWQTDRLPRVRM
jgi:uncharacterized caspase-like protein